MPPHPPCRSPVRRTTRAALAAACSFACLVAQGATSVGADADPVQGDAAPLRISAFRDISAFILETIGNRGGPTLDITYVKNADAAHADLMQRRADIVFMSYDDTLSIALLDRNPDVAAFLPVHGGILDLCGHLDTTAPSRVGIDTDSGYARAVRRFLRERLGEPRYAQLTWVKAGATDIRADALAAGDIDATLLNPPFSLRPGINRIAALAGTGTPSRYQGVVANLNRSWLGEAAHRHAIAWFTAAYRDRIAAMKNRQAETVDALSRYYRVDAEQAEAIYARLWQADGLNLTATFDPAALAGTERIFAQDTGIAVPATRTWLLDPSPAGSRNDATTEAGANPL